MALEEYNVSHSKRQARNAEKTRLVLRWLRDELCSTAETVARLLGIGAVQPVYRFLDSLVAKGLLARAKYPVDGRQVSVWGLTPHGVAFSFDEAARDDEVAAASTAAAPGPRTQATVRVTTDA